MVEIRYDDTSKCLCDECPLKPTKYPVFGYGNSQAKVMFVGEAPGQTELTTGKPFQGKSGKILDAALRRGGINREDAYVSNALLCSIPKDENTKEKISPVAAIRACRPRLVEEIRLVKPEIIVALGGSAAQSILNNSTKISDLVDSVNWSEELQAFVIPTWHPAAALHDLKHKVWIVEDVLGSIEQAAMFASGKISLPAKDQEIEYTYAATVDEVAAVLDELDNESILAIDTETDGFSYLTNKLLIISISNGKKHWVIEADAALSSPNADHIRRLFHSPIVWVLHNLQFDFLFFRRNFRAVPLNAVDTMAYGIALTEKRGTVGLKRLSRRWLGEPMYEQEIMKYVRGAENVEEANYGNVPRDILTKYAARDARNTAQLYPILSRLAEEDNTRELAERLLIPAQKAFSRASYHGIKVDTHWAIQLDKIWTPKVKEAERIVQAYAKEKGFTQRGLIASPSAEDLLNLRSPTQIIHFFYKVLGLDPMYSKEGKLTCDKTFLEEYSHIEAVELLTSFRTLDHLKSSYVLGVLLEMWPDGRIHPRVRAWVETGRVVWNEPELQTMPAHVGAKTKDDDENLSILLRRMLVPTQGYVWVHVDYSQLEMRTVWHYSKDEEMGNALKTGDVHRGVAADILQKPLDEITSEERQLGKTANFLTVYGGEEFMLAMKTGRSIEWATAFRNAYFAKYNKLAEWLDRTKDNAIRRGELQTVFGRKRRWKVIDRELRKHIRNECGNFLPQSTAGDLCTHSFIVLDEILRREKMGYPLFTNQDAIDFEIRIDRVDEALAHIYKVMTTPPFESCAEFEVEAEIGPNWGDVKELTHEQEERMKSDARSLNLSLPMYRAA